MGEWLPIETAPRNGTTILLYDPIWTTYPWRQYVSARWIAAKGRFESADYHHATATHWMPLPEPPQNQAARSVGVFSRRR